MKKFYTITFWCIFAFAAIAFSLLMFNGNVWYDEAYSLAMIRHSFLDICQITAQDVHPPMYYFMLKSFTAPFGYSLAAAKIFSALPMLLTMIMGYFKLSNIVNKKTGLLFAMMFAFLPLMTTFSVEIRMYGWSALFVTGCGLFAYTAQRDDNWLDYIIFMLFGVLAAYTHYFALVSAGIIYLMLFIKCIHEKKYKKFIVSAIGTVILYLPWLTAFVSQLAEKVENEYWIAPIKPSTVLSYFSVWFKCGDITPIYIAGIAVIFVTALISLIMSKNKRLQWIAACGAFVFVMTNIIGIVASIVVRPVFIERYAVPAMPLLMVFFAVGIGLITNKVITAVVALFFAAGFGVNYPDALKIEYDAPERRFEAMFDEAQYEALICYVDAHLYGVLSYYFPEGVVYRPKLSKGSPFTNIKALSELDTDNCKWAALFMPDGAAVPPEIAQNWSVDYVRDVSTYGIVCNMYNLWK